MAINTDLIKAFYEMGRARGSGGADLGGQLVKNQSEANNLAPQVANANANTLQATTGARQQDLAENKFQNYDMPQLGGTLGKAQADIANTNAQADYYTSGAEVNRRKEPNDKLILDSATNMFSAWFKSNVNATPVQQRAAFNQFINLARQGIGAGAAGDSEKTGLGQKIQELLSQVYGANPANLGSKLVSK